MNSMHPVVVLGSYRWDEELLPVDEFGERLKRLRSLMRERGWQGVVAHGDAPDSAFVTWLTHFFPRMRWALALVGLQGEPELLFAAPARDVPAARVLTWCSSLQAFASAKELLPQWLQRQVGDSSATRPRIGVYGMQRMRAAVRRRLEESLGGQAELIDAQAELDALMLRKRPRERRALLQARDILQASVQALRAAWAAGLPNAQAALDAERAARLACAQDIRILFSEDGGRTLRPYERRSTVRSAPLVAYIAVRYLGYWVDAFVSCGTPADGPYRAASAALAAMIATAGPGVSGTRLLAAAAPAMTGFDWHPMLEGRVASSVGLALDEPLRFDATSGDTMHDGGVYCLRAGACDDSGGAIVSALVAIVEGRPQLIFSALDGSP